MAQNLKDLAGRLPAGPRGMGTALKLLLGAGAVAYGVRESVFTGEQPSTSRTSRSPDPLDCTHTHTRAHTHPQGVRTYLLLHPRLTCADQQPVLIPTPLSTVAHSSLSPPTWPVHRQLPSNRVLPLYAGLRLVRGTWWVRL